MTEAAAVVVEEGGGFVNVFICLECEQVHSFWCVWIDEVAFYQPEQ